MPEGPFEYDLAFSFLGQDEPVASRLNDLLKDRWRTFIYFEHQKELIGRDGEVLFTKVFGKDSRLVAVLYRPNWGSTKWTRVEETAIRSRGHEEGYEFTVFIPLDTPPTKPQWLPPTRLWANLERFGVEGAAAAIDNRLAEEGAISQPETVEKKAERLRLEEEEDGARLLFLATSGTQMAAKEAVALLDAMAGLASKTGIEVEPDDQRYAGCFHRGGFTVGLQWSPPPFANFIQNGRLGVTLWGGVWLLRPAVNSQRRPREVLTSVYTFDVTPEPRRALWRPEPPTSPRSRPRPWPKGRSTACSTTSPRPAARSSKAGAGGAYLGFRAKPG